MREKSPLKKGKTAKRNPAHAGRGQHFKYKLPAAPGGLEGQALQGEEGMVEVTWWGFGVGGAWGSRLLLLGQACSTGKRGRPRNWAGTGLEPPVLRLLGRVEQPGKRPPHGVRAKILSGNRRVMLFVCSFFLKPWALAPDRILG